ncbi:SsrA-binding protein SmpB [Aquibaculum arenosum]|uniref:SsrA-binding protein n=1 Tax=Aquibaculum arenosum TaxID=3032591 RepID=A0ABT5YK91_9PROT|nr:SsrA-binding protein SmpB [Fodinicurvata sp. CAU 1616]MDF2095292.1 SsrA-binding protein SmpB [Fodinicurvata sp. CAU 1616]
MAQGRKVVAQNRRATHDYFIEERLETGLVLMGSEVKSLRAGKASLGESYAAEQKGELYLLNAHISEYAPANRFGHEPKRARKLLVHRRERERLLGLVRRDGYTLVPLAIYFNDRGMAKLELGLAKGKRKADRREDIKKRDWQRQKARLLRDRG